MATPDIVIPKGVFLKDGNFMPFALVDKLVTQHQWGQGLATFCRFDPFRPSHLSEVEWGLLLGSHGNNLDHNSAAREGLMNFAEAVKRRPNFNPPLTKMLAENPRSFSEVALGASLHDIAEYYIGDYPAGSKPPTLREIEFVIMREMGKKILAPEVGKANAADAVHAAVSILENKKHPMTQFFKTVEEVTHVEAAVTALQNSTRDLDPNAQAHLKWMGAKVITNHIATLINFTQQHPYVDIFLKDNQGAINTAFEQTPDWIVRFYEKPEDQQEMFTNFMESGTRWQTYAQRKGYTSPQRPRFVYAAEAQTISAQPVLF